MIEYGAIDDDLVFDGNLETSFMMHDYLYLKFSTACSKYRAATRDFYVNRLSEIFD